MRRLALILAALIAGPAIGQEPPPICGPRAEQIAGFLSTYGEIVAGYGIGLDGKLTEIIVNPDTGSWSIITTDTAGTTCFVSGGEMWQPVVTPRGSPA